jgi:aryl-alcohol dehydrogenase-like predicted oxidoreductase
METRKLGSLDVSVVGLGCNNFGMRCDEAQSAAVVDAAIDAGINFFDTADVYGGTRSETFLGKALGRRRDEVIIATKFASPVDSDPEHRGASARWIAQAVEDSLRRLGTDRIDLYQQHRPDDQVPLEETIEALDKLVRDGKVVELGNSNFSGELIHQAESISADKGQARFVSAQNELNLLRRRARDEVLPACTEAGIGFLPFFPLASGLLTGKYRRGEGAPEGTRLAGMPEERKSQVLTERNFSRLEALSAFAEERDHTLLDLAFAWLLALPSMTSVIAGATQPDQVRTNAAAAGWTLDQSDLDQIDKILEAAVAD